jgi:hypothetical protein
VAEETIVLLRTQPTRKSDDTDGKTDLQIRECKTKLSHAAHKACKALGDLDGAIEYLEDAKRYEPKRSDEFDQNTLALRSGMSYASETRQDVVVWEPETEWSSRLD